MAPWLHLFFHGQFGRTLVLPEGDVDIGDSSKCWASLRSAQPTGLIMKKQFLSLKKPLLWGSCLCLGLISCSSDQYKLTQPPNYDYLIGKSFSESIFMGGKVYKKIRETDTIEELEERRSDGCILVFGVRKSNDVIEYWRVDSGPGTCYTRKKALSV
jgi:hypothetical protein